MDEFKFPIVTSYVEADESQCGGCFYFISITY